MIAAGGCGTRESSLYDSRRQCSTAIGPLLNVGASFHKVVELLTIV